MSKIRTWKRMTVERLDDRCTPGAATTFYSELPHPAAPLGNEAAVASCSILPPAALHSPFENMAPGNGGPTLCSGPSYTGDTNGGPSGSTGSTANNGWDNPYYV